MAVRPKGEKRKGRLVRATDTEWDCVREDAAAAGLSISEYVMRTLLARPEPAEPGLPPALVRRLARAVLILERLERTRFEKRGGEDVWRALVAETEAEIDARTAPD